MREILFRAKRIDNGEWIVGCLLIDYITGQYFLHALGNSINESSKIGEEGYLRFAAFEIDPSTLCQYTGLKGKNGNRIWENDIVKIENSMNEGIGNIEFYGGMWYVDGEPSNSLHDIVEYDDVAKVEVIGNIFDNPELLKGKMND